MAVKASVIRVKAIKGSGSKSSCIGYGSLSAAGKVIIGVLPTWGAINLVVSFFVIIITFLSLVVDCWNRIKYYLLIFVLRLLRQGQKTATKR